MINDGTFVKCKAMFRALADFMVSMIRRSAKEICELFENHSEHAQTANNTREPQYVSPPFLFRISFWRPRALKTKVIGRF